MPATARTPSPLRSAASRANGARSRGPKTPQGKARSCRNATRHGFYAKTPLPIDENSAEFHAIAGEFVRHYFPDPDPFEIAAIHELAACRCRLRLACALEKEWMEQEIAITGSIANAFAALAETAKFRMLQRLEDRAFRTFHGLLAALVSHRTSKYDETNPRTIFGAFQTPAPNEARLGMPRATAPVPSVSAVTSSIQQCWGCARHCRSPVAGSVGRPMGGEKRHSSANNSLAARSAPESNDTIRRRLPV
jgi:hypothetical protein